jgi:hypothetical protein
MGINSGIGYIDSVVSAAIDGVILDIRLSMRRNALRPTKSQNA